MKDIEACASRIEARGRRCARLKRVDTVMLTLNADAASLPEAIKVRTNQEAPQVLQQELSREESPGGSYWCSSWSSLSLWRQASPVSSFAVVFRPWGRTCRMGNLRKDERCNIDHSQD